MSDSMYSKPSRPSTRKNCDRCGSFCRLSLDGNHIDCPNCGTYPL